MTPSKKDNTKAAPPGTQKIHSNYKDCKYSAVALTFNNLVVLSKRVYFCPVTKKPVPFGGYWSVFTGGIEDGETAEQAAVREVKEESDIDIQEKGLHFLGKVKDLALFAYELEKLEPVKLNFEHTESGYFKIPEIHTSPDPIDIDIARAIQYYNFINS